MFGRGNMSDTVLAKMGWKRKQSLINTALNPPKKSDKGASPNEPSTYKDLEEFDDTHVVYQENGAWFICPYTIGGTGDAEKATLGKAEKLILTRAVGLGKKALTDQGADAGEGEKVKAPLVEKGKGA